MNLQQLHEEGEKSFDQEFTVKVTSERPDLDPLMATLVMVPYKRFAHSERTKAWNAALEYTITYLNHYNKNRGEVGDKRTVNSVLESIIKSLSEGMEKE